VSNSAPQQPRSTSLPRHRVRGFFVPKIGETDADIQDAIAVNPNHNLIAIADGVSSSLFPREWANILVQAFCNDRLVSVSFLQKSWRSWLKPLQQNWRTFYLENIAILPWWAKGSDIKSHGRSTFVGLELKPHPEQGRYHWSALTVGDSCLFIVNRQSQQLRSLPISKSSEFSNQTDSWGSLPEQESTPPRFWSGDCAPNEYFLLATDALAKWILQNYESGGQDWTRLVQITHRDAFAGFVDRLRVNNAIADDDTSIIIVEPAFTQPAAQPVARPATMRPAKSTTSSKFSTDPRRAQDRAKAKPSLKASPQQVAPQRAAPQKTDRQNTLQGKLPKVLQVILIAAFGLSLLVLLFVIITNFS